MKSALLLVLCLTPFAYGADEEALIGRLLAYQTLPRLTDTQIDVAGSVITFCRDPKEIHGPHIRPGIHLYANQGAIDARRSSAPRYPVGALLVKEKFEVKGGILPHVITVMEKIADEGKIEDWRFSMIRLSDRSLVRDGFEVSCVDCHSRYTESDFVSPVTDSLLRGFAEKFIPAPASAAPR